MKIPGRIFLVPVLLAGLIGVLNLQWLKLYQLMNAPQADSLVYLTEAYNDYWSIRSWDWAHLFQKYVSSGTQQTSPLLWGTASIFFMIFGLDPVVAYYVILLAYLGWVAGTVYLAWVIVPARDSAVACGLCAAFLPSVTSWGLRNFMLDFVAAAPFVWSTALLLRSDLFEKRRESLLYAFLVGLTILFRTTALVYFASHIGILVIQILQKRKIPNLKNMALVFLGAFLTCGWFVLPNLRRILEYYGYWAEQAWAAQPHEGFFNNLAFYLQNIRTFHLESPGFAVLLIFSCLGLLALAGKYGFLKKAQAEHKWDLVGILVIPILVILPTICLASYPSRAVTVDYLFISGYLMFPILIWKAAFSRSAVFWVGCLPLLACLGFSSLRHLIAGLEINDYREREVLQMIFKDAEERGKKTIRIGNTSIHQHNCLSYQYWTLANYFPNWRGKVELTSIGRTQSPEELATMNRVADYVISLKNYHADWHPNNVVAPKADQILQKKYGMRPLPRVFDLPDGVRLQILCDPISLEVPAGQTDGWHANNVILSIRNPASQNLKIRFETDLFMAANTSTAKLTLTPKNKPEKKISITSVGSRVNQVLEISRDCFSGQELSEFVIHSDAAGSPKESHISGDSRELAFLNLRVTRLYGE